MSLTFQNAIGNEQIITTNSGQIAGLRNRIINGDMRIDQRNNGAAVTPSAVNTSVYLADRFYHYSSSASKLTYQQVVDAPAGFKFSTKISVAAQYAPTAADIFVFGQTIEGLSIIDFQLGASAAATITLSNYIKGSVAGSYAVSLRNSTLTRTYLGTVSVTTSWAPVKITIVGDIMGAWATDNTAGLALTFDLGSGTNMNGTNGTWQAGNLLRTAGSVTFVNQSAGSTLNITGVQLEVGSVATPLEQRPYGMELALCQRYYETTGGGTRAEAISFVPTRADFSAINVRYQVTKRATPTVTIYAAISGTTGTVRQIDGGGSPADIATTINSTVSEIASVIGTYQVGTHYGFNFAAAAEL